MTSATPASATNGAASSSSRERKSVGKFTAKDHHGELWLVRVPAFGFDVLSLAGAKMKVGEAESPTPVSRFYVETDASPLGGGGGGAKERRLMLVREAYDERVGQQFMALAGNGARGGPTGGPKFEAAKFVLPLGHPGELQLDMMYLKGPTKAERAAAV